MEGGNKPLPVRRSRTPLVPGRSPGPFRVAAQPTGKVPHCRTASSQARRNHTGRTRQARRLCGSDAGPGGLGVAVAQSTSSRDTSGMGLSWGDWIRFVIVPIFVVALTTAVAMRNAKKAPYERLKNLVEIQEKMPNGLDSKKVVEAAIARELVDFDRRVSADQRGFWPGLWERLAQIQPILLAYWFIGVGVVLAAFIVYLPDKRLQDGSAEMNTLAGASLVSAFGALITVIIAHRSRISLRVDRISAQLVATFPHSAIDYISCRDSLATWPGDPWYADLRRLEDQGVFKVQENVKDSVVYRPTAIGRRAIQSALAEVNHQRPERQASAAAQDAGCAEQTPGREVPGE